MREQKLQLHRIADTVRNTQLTYQDYEREKSLVKEMDYKDYEEAVKQIAKRLLL